jgi:hypothetical protein
MSWPHIPITSNIGREDDFLPYVQDYNTTGTTVANRGKYEFYTVTRRTSRLTDDVLQLSHSERYFNRFGQSCLVGHDEFCKRRRNSSG